MSKLNPLNLIKNETKSGMKEYAGGALAISTAALIGVYADGGMVAVMADGSGLGFFLGSALALIIRLVFKSLK